MNINLKGRTCVVTGAAGSIGLAIAETYCRLAASVALIDLNPEVMRHAKRLERAGYKVLGYVLNISNREAVFACLEDISNNLGPVFALVNGAGIVEQCHFEDITPEQLERINEININGSIYCAQAALKTMKSLNDGRIINFSSKSGKSGSALMAAYSASKGAIIALTQAMAQELGSKNIKVNCLCPGPIGDSDMWPESD